MDRDCLADPGSISQSASPAGRLGLEFRATRRVHGQPATVRDSLSHRCDCRGVDLAAVQADVFKHAIVDFFQRAFRCISASCFAPIAPMRP